MRRTYTSQEKVNAVLALRRGGATLESLHQMSGIPSRNLYRWLEEDTAWAEGGNDGPYPFVKKRGRDSVLPKECEGSLYEWIVGQQLEGAPVSRKMIIRKARQISKLLDDVAVGEGWYRKFLQRFPDIRPRISQAVSKVRNTVTDLDVAMLFSSLAKVVENDMDGSRMFNIDETAFESSSKTTRVMVLKGSKNVWHTNATASFHLSFVACASARGFIAPPLFILPGQRVDNEVLEGCSIPGAAVTTTEKAFMTSTLFSKWLRFFSDAVPSTVKRPLLLLMDGCSSHLSTEIFDTAHRLQILLVCLPANGTHLLQPLDVAVFASFKSTLQELIDTVVGASGETSISKVKALQIATLAWTSCNFDKNISSGFKSCGIFPPSKVKMSEKLYNYQRNGAPVSAKKALWLRHKETVQHEFLLLTASHLVKTKKRKTKTVAGRLLTREMLEREDDLPTNSQKSKAKKAKDSKLSSKLPLLNLPTPSNLGNRQLSPPTPTHPPFNMTMPATAVQQVAHEHEGEQPPSFARSLSDSNGASPPQDVNQPKEDNHVSAREKDPGHDQPSQRNGPPTTGVTIGDLLRGGHEFREDDSGQHEDEPGNITADEDGLELIREAYSKGVLDPEQLLRLAENAQPSPVRDAPFSVKATFGGSLQNLSRPKIIANLKLITDNPVICEVLDNHAVVHVHKLPRSQLMFQVNSKDTKKQLERQSCLFLGKNVGV